MPIAMKFNEMDLVMSLPQDVACDTSNVRPDPQLIIRSNLVLHFSMLGGFFSPLLSYSHQNYTSQSIYDHSKVVNEFLTRFYSMNYHNRIFVKIPLRGLNIQFWSFFINV